MQVAPLCGNGVVESKGAVTDTVTNVVQTVVELTKLLTKQDFLLGSSGCVLTEFALTVPTISAKAEHEEEEHDNEEPTGTPAVVSAVNSSAKIRQAVIVQKNHSFRFILCQQPPVHRKPLTLLQELHKLLRLFLQALKLLI